LQVENEQSIIKRPKSVLTDDIKKKWPLRTLDSEIDYENDDMIVQALLCQKDDEPIPLNMVIDLKRDDKQMKWLFKS
jgi:hypothetical protein